MAARSGARFHRRAPALLHLGRHGAAVLDGTSQADLDHLEVQECRRSEDSLELWHLPAEKCRAMDAVFAVARDENSWFWTAGQDEFIQRVG